MQGIFIQSRSKWITEGEKPSKYLCNLQNRNYVSKITNSLYSKSGYILTSQQDIMNEAMNHYKDPYSYRQTEDVLDIHVNTNLHKNASKLNEEENR